MTVHEMPPGANMWELDADLYVVPVNCVGIFGAGLAKTFATRWPHLTKGWEADCEAREVGPGCTRIEVIGQNAHGSMALAALFATRDDWRHPAELKWIEAGLHALWHVAHMNHVCPRGRIAMPALGCGSGKLPYDDVRGMITWAFDSDPRVSVALFPPHN